MSEPSDGADGDGSGKPKSRDEGGPIREDDNVAATGEVRDDLEVPATRKQEAVKSEATADDAPSRPSSIEIDHAPLIYPDDGSVSAGVRKLDRQLGVAEQGVLVALLSAIILFAAGNAILDKLAGIQIHLKDEIIRGGTFAIALLGAAFATQQSRHLAMDLISRRLSPRARLILKVILSLFVVFIVSLLVRAGYHTVKIQKPSDELIFTPTLIAWMVPVGGCLVILHTIFHIIIDVDYLARHKLPPERMRSGH